MDIVLEKLVAAWSKSVPFGGDRLSVTSLVTFVEQLDSSKIVARIVAVLVLLRCSYKVNRNHAVYPMRNLISELDQRTKEMP